MAGELDIFERAVRAARRTLGGNLGLRRKLRADLKALGMVPRASFCRALGRSTRDLWFVGYLDALRYLSHHDALCRALEAPSFTDEMLHALGSETLRPFLTPRLIRDLDDPQLENQVAIWDYIEALEAAFDSRLIGARRIRDAEHFTTLGFRAKELLRSGAYKFPPPPFPAPFGWAWFETGADFASLADYDSNWCVHHPAQHHFAIRRGERYLLRDALGCGWQLQRMPNAAQSDQ